MAINFPTSPSLNDTYTTGGITWTWDGSTWKASSSFSETDPVYTASAAANVTNTKITNWDTSYGWGDHGTVGYLTSYTETDPAFNASAASTITGTQVTNWDTAYGWGDHAGAGYLTAASQSLDAVLSVGSTTARDITTTGKIYYSNNFADLTALNSVSAATYHGMFAHVHAENHGYFAHAGAWIQLLDTGSSLSELADVATTTPSTSDVLTWDGSNWGPAAPTGGGGAETDTLASVTGRGATTSSNLTLGGIVQFNNNAAFANDKVLNFGGGSNGRILYVSATNSFDVRVPGGSEDLKLGAGTAVRITNENGLTDRAVFTSSGVDVTGTLTVSNNTIITSSSDGAGGYHTMLENNSTGDLYFRGTELYIQDNANANQAWIHCLPNAGVNLHYAGATKFETTSTGVTITGALTSDSFVKSGGTSSEYLMADGSVTTGGGGSSLQSRTTASASTPSIANDVSADIVISAAKTYALQKIQTSAAAWVTLYTDTTSRTNDASRTETTDPVSGSGVIAEVITTGAVTQKITPGTIGWNDDGTPSSNVYLKVVNKSGSTNPITVTLYYVQLEA